MKRWLAILALIWAVATINAAEDYRCSPVRAEIHTSVLSPAEDNTSTTDNAPLLATPCQGPTQLSSTEQGPVRTSRHAGSHNVGAIRGFAYMSILYLSAPATEHCMASPPPSIRTPDRYIYYLRRIII